MSSKLLLFKPETMPIGIGIASDLMRSQYFLVKPHTNALCLQGDSGGPLLCRDFFSGSSDRDRYYVVGIVSNFPKLLFNGRSKTEC